MSRIYFHSEQEETEVYGTERHYMGKIVSDFGVIPLLSMCQSLIGKDQDPEILKYLPHDCYLVELFHKHPDDFKRAFVTWFHVSSDGLILDGVDHTCWTLSLNTAIVAGSDPIKLYARIHGLCELHGYVEGHNRAWLASIIKQGLETSVYRKNRGWENTIKMLESDNQSPVVMSYSVCDYFPNQEVACYDDKDKWYGLSICEQWNLAMQELRKNHHWLEISPDFWDDYYFGNGTNSFTIREHDSKSPTPPLT